MATQSLRPLRAAFPHVVTSRKYIHDRFNAIRLLRNRVFHHEAIWHRPNLSQEHIAIHQAINHEAIWHRPNLSQEHIAIHQAINWISPTLHRAIHSVDNFPRSYTGKARVEARLKSLLGTS